MLKKIMISLSLITFLNMGLCQAGPTIPFIVTNPIPTPSPELLECQEQVEQCGQVLGKALIVIQAYGEDQQNRAKLEDNLKQQLKDAAAKIDELQVPWYEKPGFVIPATVVTVVGIGYYIGRK